MDAKFRAGLIYPKENVAILKKFKSRELDTASSMELKEFIRQFDIARNDVGERINEIWMKHLGKVPETDLDAQGMLQVLKKDGKLEAWTKDYNDLMAFEIKFQIERKLAVPPVCSCDELEFLEPILDIKQKERAFDSGLGKHRKAA
jgi:hypothetical protein